MRAHGLRENARRREGQEEAGRESPCTALPVPGGGAIALALALGGFAGAAAAGGARSLSLSSSAVRGQAASVPLAGPMRPGHGPCPCTPAWTAAWLAPASGRPPDNPQRLSEMPAAPGSLLYLMRLDRPNPPTKRTVRPGAFRAAGN
jgi:hypothetical protein